MSGCVTTGGISGLTMIPGPCRKSEVNLYMQDVLKLKEEDGRDGVRMDWD